MLTALSLLRDDDPDRVADGTWLIDDVLVLANAWWEPLEFVLPETRPQVTWQVELDTYDLAFPAGPAAIDHKAGDHVTVGPRSIVVLLAASVAPSDARTAVTGRRFR